MKENLHTRLFFLGPQIRQTHDIVSKLDYVFQNGTWLVATGRDFDDDHAYLLCRWCLHALASHLRETSAGVHEMCTKEEPGAQTKANASRWPFHKARDGKPDSSQCVWDEEVNKVKRIIAHPPRTYAAYEVGLPLSTLWILDVRRSIKRHPPGGFEWLLGISLPCAASNMVPVTTPAPRRRRLREIKQGEIPVQNKYI